MAKRLEESGHTHPIIRKRTEYFWFEEPKCYACHAELEPVHPTGNHPKESGHYENALEIRFNGGYAMFIDLGYPTIFLCHNCAHEACESLEWMDRLLQPRTSHTHSVNKDWGDHQGADLPHEQ